MTRARDVANIDGILTTTGDTFYASSGGTPARLGIGSTDQVLKVSGGVPTWATASAGGMTLIATATPSAASTFSFASIPSTYKHLLVVVPELVWSVTNQHARMSFATGSYYSARAMGTWGNSGTFFYATERGSTSFGGGSDYTCPIQKGYTSSGTFGDISSATSIWINNYTATIDRLVTWQAAGNGGMFTATGIYDHNAAIDNITFTTQAGTVTGTAYLYGVS